MIAKVHGVHHVSFSVKNPDLTVKFFLECLGARVDETAPTDPSPTRLLVGGNVFISIGRTKGVTREFDSDVNAGLHHIAFQVKTEEDLIALHDRCCDFEGAKSEIPPERLDDKVVGGLAKHCWIREPNGMRVELIWVA